MALCVGVSVVVVASDAVAVPVVVTDVVVVLVVVDDVAVVVLDAVVVVHIDVRLLLLSWLVSLLILL